MPLAAFALLFQELALEGLYFIFKSGLVVLQPSEAALDAAGLAEQVAAPLRLRGTSRRRGRSSAESRTLPGRCRGR